jgi:hypothetical protein
VTVSTNLRIDLTDPDSIPIEDVRLCQANEGRVVKNRHMIDTKGLLKGNINRIARGLRTVVLF